MNAPAPRPPLTVWLYLALTWVLGWWMLIDGLRQRVLGDYFRIGGQLGPWADLVRAVGVDPMRMGVFFVALGSAFLGAGFGIYLRRRWGYGAGLVLCAASLFYLGLGTPLAVASLVLLALRPTRAYALAE